MIYFEDLEIGKETHFGSYEVTREEVIKFAAKYDPQPFHLSDEAAAQTHFGRLAASGWHTCAMTRLSRRYAGGAQHDRRKDALAQQAGNRLVPQPDDRDQPRWRAGPALHLDRIDAAAARRLIGHGDRDGIR
jgi:hypothetical protein